MIQIDRELFDQYLQLNFDLAQKVLQEDPTTQVVPKLMVAITDEDDDDDWQVHLIVFEEFGEDRYEIMSRLGAKYGFEQMPVVALFLVTEGWVSMTTKEEWAGHVENRIPPSEDPERQEALFVFGMTLDLHAGCLSAWIERDANDQAILQQPQRLETDIESNLLEAFWASFAQAYLMSSKDS